MKYVYASYKVTLAPVPIEYFWQSNAQVTNNGSYPNRHPILTRYPYLVDCKTRGSLGTRVYDTCQDIHEVIRGKTFFAIGQGQYEIGNNNHNDACFVQPDPQDFVMGGQTLHCVDISDIRNKIHMVNSYFRFRHVFFMNTSRLYIRVRKKRIDLAKSIQMDRQIITEDEYGGYIGNTPIIKDDDYNNAACEFFADDYLRFVDERKQCHIAIRKRAPQHVHLQDSNGQNLLSNASILKPFNSSYYTSLINHPPTGPLLEIALPDPWPQDASEQTVVDTHLLETQENMYIGHIIVRYAYDYDKSTILEYTKDVEVGSYLDFTLENDKAAGVRHVATISILDSDGGVVGSPIVVDIPRGVTGTSIRIPQEIGQRIGNSTVCSARFDLQTIGCEDYFVDESLGHDARVFNITVPQNIVPAINTFTVTPTAPASIADWDSCVQGISKIKVAVNVTPAPGTSITRYIFSGGCSAIEQTSETSIEINNLDVNRFGQAVFTVRVYDTRGRYAQSSQTISVYPYSPPRIKRASVQRWNIAGGTHDEESTSVRITADKQYSPCGNKNSVTLSYRIETEDGELVKGGQITNANAFYVQNPTLEVDKTYRVIFTAQDLFRTVTKELYINSNTYTIYFKPNGNVVSFGKMADTSKYNCVELDQNWTIMRGDEDILDKIDSLQHRLSNLGV